MKTIPKLTKTWNHGEIKNKEHEEDKADRL